MPNCMVQKPAMFTFKYPPTRTNYDDLVTEAAPHPGSGQSKINMMKITREKHEKH